MKPEGKHTVRKFHKWVLKGGIIGLLIQSSVSVTLAGSFIGSLGSGSSLNNRDFILHPKGYDGSGTSLTVNLCIVPGTPNAASMVTPIANIAAKMTAQTGKTGNLSTGDGGDEVPFSSYDFESIALHEVGHCLGLAHVNAATESGLPSAQRDYTKAAVGANAALNVGAGADGIIGSKDDLRGDDVSVHWFRKGSNDPCADPGTNTFDSTTYSVDGALPIGHDFVANADASVCSAIGSSNTEAVMQQGSPNGQAQRFLGHDDAAMLRLAMSGLDEVQGTADDYSLSVQSLGISDSPDCDINLSFDNNETGFAVCKTSYFTSTNGNTDHGRIASSNAYFNAGAVTWFFNSTLDDTSARADDFVTTWKTDNPGSSNSTSVTVPIVGGPYDVDWNNDGIFDQTGLTGSVTHNFGSTGTYTFRIKGTYDSIRFNFGGDVAKILSVDQWGGNQWNTMERAFPGAVNLQINATDTPDFSAVTSMENMFADAVLVDPDTSDWNTSEVTIMAYMFFGATTANPNTTNWNTGKVTDMEAMFYNATSANPDISAWDVTSLTFAADMFTLAGLSLQMYESVLINWNSQNLKKAVRFNAGSSVYASAAAVAAKANMISFHEWIITDGGQVFPPAFTVGGNVSGLNGSGLVLQNNAGDDLAVSGNGSFTFDTALVDASTYAVTVKTQPANLSQTCSVSNGTGTIATSQVTNVSVSCVTDSFTVGGFVSGLIASGLVLQNNGGDDLVRNGSGAFEFTTPLVDGSAYAVTVKTQPPDLSQVCVINSGSGTLAGTDVTNVSVFCAEPCNARVVAGVTENSLITHEACEVLVVGPGFIAEDGAEVFLSSGWVIEMMPGFQIEQGATLNAAVCGQSLCETSSSPMPDGCHSCVVDICDVDPFCCNTEFDFICVGEVYDVCGLVCK